MKKKRKLGRKLLSFLLTLAMVVGLMPGMSLTAYATGEKAYAAYDVTTETNKTKSGDDLTALQVTFNGKKWYIIEDNSSSATSGTVTLLSADTTFGTKKFADNDNDKYSTSQVKTYLDNMTEPDGEFADVADAIETVNLTTNAYGGNDVYETVNNVKLYLLSKEEAESLPVNVRKAEFGGGNSYDNVWWLRSPDSDDVGAMFVDGVDGSLCDYADDVDYVFGVRPALQLDLSKVVFDSTNNSFDLKPHKHGEMTFQAWNSSTSLPDSAGNYYLGCNVTLQGDYNNENPEYNNPTVWTVPSGTTNLCLNGHSISITDKWSRLEVPNGSTLNLYDDGETGTVIQTDQDSVVSMFNINGGQLNLYSGTLSGAFAVNIEGSGTFTMYGGNVQGYRAVGVESGVFNLEAGQIIATGQGVGVGDSGYFTMSGGKITGSSLDQPAVGVSGTFTMSGGEICNNNCPSNEWGTVSVGGTFNMEDGSIYGNTAKRGGGIGVVGNGTINLTGGSIYGNTAENGGGVYAYVSSDEYYKSHVNITGGSITGNNATSWGGGVYGAECVYLSGSPQIHDNYLNGELSESVYTKGTAGANNNLCITNSGDEDNIDYFNVNGELSSDSRVGINLPTEKLDAATFPLVISHGFGGRIEEEDGESSDEWYFNGGPDSYFFFDRDGYTLTEKQVEYNNHGMSDISEVAVGLNRVDYTEDYPHETYDYNVISGGSGAQNWSTKKTDQVIFEDTTITGNIQIKSSTDVTRIIYGDYSEGANLTVNGSIYSDALTDGDGSGNLRVCGTLVEYCKLRVVSQTADAPAINVKNISVYGATLELAGKEGGSALRSDAYISSPYTFIYESDDGINYTYHPYTSGSNTPIGNLKRYVKINNTEPEWVAEVTSGDDTSKYVDFADALTAWKSESGKTLKLLKDVTTTDTITVTGGTSEAPLVLDLNGQGIMYTGNGKAPVITVDNGGVFNLNDSDTTKKHYITLTSGRGTAVSDANSDGAIEVTGGYITGGTGFKDGSTLRGGGVLVKNGTFTISGGTIVGNNAKDGGGVSVAYNSNFTMNGGSIYYNTASENAGGVFAYGVTGSNKASIIINEGNIIKNTAQYGGGVFIGSLGAFTMNGGKIEGNTATFAGGGVVQNGNEYEFAVNGGSITENKAMSLAGGIACGGPFNLSGGVIITGNKVGDEDENVYLIEDGAITLTDALSDTASIGITMQTPSVFTSSTGDIKAKDYSSRFFSDNSEYIVKADGNELKLSTHEHRFTYSAEDGTITATCTDQDGCPLADNDYKATLTISANGGTYDGTTSYEATVTDENSIKGDAVVNYYKATDSGERGEALSPLTTAPVNAGRYWAEITLGTGEDAKTAHVVYTIEKAAETAPAADTNQLNINYPNETISANSGYEVASDDNGTEITYFSSILDETTPTVYIRKTASDDNHAPSDWVPVTLSSRPAAPTGLGSTNATDGASEDGTIIGVSETMEYSADGTNWTSVNGTTITGLKAGTYKVRVKATETAPCGNAAEVIVGSNYKALDETVSVIIKKGDSEIGETVPVVDDVLTADCEASNIIYQWYRGGEPIDGATEGTYTLTKDDVGKAITVQAIQTKKADGTNYGENDRPMKMSESTEAVVKKDGPAAPASAQVAEFVPDYSAETFTIGEGYEVSSADSEDEIITGNSLTDVIDGTRKIYIRVKETEDTKAGAWLEVTLPARPAAPTGLGSTNATDGASEDGTITGVSETMEYSADGTNWTSVNGTTITGLKAGTYKVRVKATEDKPVGEIAEVTVGSRKLTLTDRQKPTEKTDLKYNGSDQALLCAPADGLPDGAVEIIYAIGENTDTAPEPDADGTPDDQKRWLTSIPTATNVGTYYVWYKVVGDENHNDFIAEKPIQVTISKASVAIEWGETELVYNGTAQAPTATIKSGVADNDTGKVSVEVSGAQTNVNEATSTYTATASLTGEGAGNYEIADTDKTKAFTIKAKDMTVSAADVNATYDGEAHQITVNVTEPTGATITYRKAENEDYSETNPTFTNAGVYTVYYRVEKANYNTITGTAKVNITKKAVTVTPDSNQSKVYGAKDTAFTYKAEGLVEGETLKGALSRAEGENVGEYAYTTGTLATENPNYEVSLAENAGKFAIKKATLTVTADAKQITYGDSDVALTYTVTGLVGEDTADKVISGAITREEGTAIGTYKITQGTLKVNDNYDITFVGADYVIKKAAQTAPAETFTTSKASGNDVADGKIEGFAAAKVYQYSADAGQNWIDVKAGDTSLSVKSGTYQIRYAGDNNHEAGASVEVAVGTKENQSKPEGLAAGNVSAENASDGAVTGVTDKMEYSTDDGNTWKAVTDGADTIEGLAKGEVSVRYKGDADKNPSEAAKVIVGVASKTEGIVDFKPEEGSDSAEEKAVTGVDSESTKESVEEFADTQKEEGKDVKVALEITPVKEEDLKKENAQTVEQTETVVKEVFKGIDKTEIVTEYLAIDVAKYVDNNPVGETISDTKTPLEIALKYDTRKKNPIVVRTHNGIAKAFEKLGSRPAKKDFKDAHYYIDAENEILYVYSQFFSDFAIVYSKENTYTISIDTGIGDPIVQVVGEGSKLDLPTDLKKDGYAFDGWFKDLQYSSPWDADNDKVNEDTKIYGKWNKSVTGISVTSAATVDFTKAGDTSQIKVNVSPSDAANTKVSYSSSDARVATVDDNGKVTAVGNGTATITVTTEDGKKTATVMVNVAIPEVNPQGTPDDPKAEDPTTEEQPTTTESPVAEPTKEEKATLAMNAGLKISQTGSKINIKWGKVKEADGYEVYVTYCGMKFGKSVKVLKNNAKTSINVTKINGKKINLKKNFKVYVAAYKMVGGKKKKLAKTITGHIVGRKNTAYTNVKMIKLAKSKYSIKAGKAAQINAKTVLVDKKKKQLSNAHATQFRYASSNKNIATVSKNGKIKGIAKGTCTIYVYARNGYAKTVNVTVK